MSKQKLIKIITAIILKYAEPERIYLFGSQATGDATIGSDIDVAFYDENFKDDFLIEDEIQKLETLVKIDVKNLANCDERFINRVKSTGKILYSASKKLRAEDGLYNFEKSLAKFNSVLERENEFQEQGFEDMFLDVLTKRFEFTFEMSWKAIKRYLDFVGIDAKNPRQVFKEAYAQNILKDENIWLEMIEQRNLSSHVYNELEVSEIIDKKEAYSKAFNDLLQELKQNIGE